MPEVVVRLHVEPHLGVGPERSLEAQRPRCADAGTTVQQRGKSLPGNAEALGCEPALKFDQHTGPTGVED